MTTQQRRNSPDEPGNSEEGTGAFLSTAEMTAQQMQYHGRNIGGYCTRGFGWHPSALTDRTLSLRGLRGGLRGGRNGTPCLSRIDYADAELSSIIAQTRDEGL